MKKKSTGLSLVDDDYCLFTSNIRTMKSRRMRWVGSVACIGEILLGKPEGGDT
jgi:hypothetical protein